MKYILLILALAVRVAAASITHTATIFPTLTDWSLTNSVPQFDPAIGTLTNVTVTVSANVQSTFFTENRDRRAWDTTTTAHATVSAFVDTLSASTLIEPSHTQNLTAFDGVIDYDGTSGFTASDSGTGTASNSTSVVAPFIGVGTVPLTASSVATASYTGSGFYRFIVNTSASAIVTVTYDFSLPACPPAPVCDPNPSCDPKPDCKPWVKPPQKDDDCDDDDDRRKRRNRRR